MFSHVVLGYAENRAFEAKLQYRRSSARFNHNDTLEQLLLQIQSTGPACDTWGTEWPS